MNQYTVKTNTIPPAHWANVAPRELPATDSKHSGFMLAHNPSDLKLIRVRKSPLRNTRT